MTDAEYKTEKKRIQKVIDKWFSPMGLGWFQVEFEWSRSPCEKDPNIAAEVNTQWHYRSALVTWYMPIMKELSEEKLENVIVHEFVHILINPLTLVEKSEDLSMQHEFATETLAKAFEWVRKAGQEDKK